MFRLISLILALSLPAIAQANCSGPSQFDALAADQQAALRDRAHQVPFAEGLLWRVEKSGVISYIVGTLHLPDPRHQATLETLVPLMAEVDTLFLEMTSETESDFMRDLTSDPSQFLMPQGSSLIDALGEDVWHALLPHLKARGVPGAMASRYQPWFLGMTMSIAPCAMKALQSGKPGLDRQIENEALALQVATRSLDSPQGMIDMFTSSPLETQVDDLRQAIEAKTIDADGTEALIALYFAGETQLAWDFNAYIVLKTAEAHGVPELEDQLQRVEQSLLVERNQQWLEILATELGQTPSIVAIGALHLPGNHGVLAGLEAAGYKLDRVKIIRD